MLRGITHLSVEPQLGMINDTVTVTWCLGEEVQYTPQPSDEMRLIDTNGVVFSRCMLWDAKAAGAEGSLREGEVHITCPSFGGSFILTLFDASHFIRIVSVPYRVAGRAHEPRQLLDVGRAEAAPLVAGERVDVTYDLNDVEEGDGVFCICRVGTGDNSGYMKYPTEPLEHVVPHSVVRAPSHRHHSPNSTTHTIGMVAPTQLGQYEVRYMQVPPCGVYYTLLRSAKFSVEKLWDDMELIQGTLSLSTYRCVAGDALTAHWDIGSYCASLISALDTIAFHPYGRAEAISQQSEDLRTCVAYKSYKGSIELSAPKHAGFYDVGYRSFHTQRIPFYGKPLTVDYPEGRLKCGGAKKGCKVADVLEVEWSVEATVHCSQDRILLYDLEGVPVISTAIEKPKGRKSVKAEHSDRPDVDVLVGRVGITPNRPGRYSVHYYSHRLGYILFSLEDKLNVKPSSAFDLPVASIHALSAVQLGAVVEVIFEKQGSDHRDMPVKKYDALGLFPADAQDGVLSPVFDSSGTVPAIYMEYPRDRMDAELAFPPIHEPGEYEIRYLVANERPHQYTCSSYVRFTVKPREEFGKMEKLVTVKNAPLAMLAETVHKYPEMVEDGEESAAPHRSLGTTGSRLSRVSSLSNTRSLSSGGGASGRASKSMGKKSLTSILHFNDATEFKGAVLGPRICSTTEQVVVTYHLTAGFPSSKDKIVLLNVECTKLISEMSVGLSIGREDLSLGTVSLLAPKSAGNYRAGYFSDAHCSIVLASDPFRVANPDGSLHSETLNRRSSGAFIGGSAPESPTLEMSQQSAATGGMPSRPLSRPAAVKCLIVACSYLTKQYELKGPVNDASRMQDLFMTHFDVPDDSIRVLHDMQPDPELMPTAYNIRSSLRWLASGAQAKDKLFFYFSGCGSRLVLDASGAEKIVDNVLLPIDFDWSQRVVPYRELHATLYGGVPSGTHVACLIDCCFTSNTLEWCLQKNVWRETAHMKPKVDISRVDGHLGVRSIWHAREKKHVLSRAQQRCVAPTDGMFHNLTGVEIEETRPSCGFLSSLLFHPFSTSTQSWHTSGTNKGFVLLEASRGSSLRHDIAWDVFVEDQGMTLGLFTHALCTTVESGDLDVVTWSELYERVMRELRRSAYPDQHPRLWVGDVAALNVTVLHPQPEA